MWAYIATAVFCVLLWKLVSGLLSSVMFFREISTCLSHFPQPIGSRWFLGISHVVKDADTYYRYVQKSVDKLQPKALATWMTWLRPTLAVVHPDTIKVVLKASHVTAQKPWEYRFLKPWLGEGLLLSEGKKWEHNRHLLTPAFHFQVLKPYVGVYNDVSELLLQKIKSLTLDGNSLDVCPLVTRATLDTVLRCALSFRDETIQATDKHQHPFLENVFKVKTIIERRWMNPLIYNDFIFGMQSDAKELKQRCSYLHEFSSNLIKLRRKALEEDSLQLKKKRHLDFLDILLTATDDSGVGLTDIEIRDEVDTFLFGGHDTTASAIMWTLYALAKYPQMQQEVRDEINNILGERNDLEYDDLADLDFTTRFIKESLRMFTPVPAINKSLEKPLSIEGVTFPVGAIIDIVPYFLHHNPAVWENHDEFQPDRFLPENFAKKDPFSFVPFSAGPRNCIGQNFAMNEIKVIISRVVKRFEVKLDSAKEAMPYREFVTSAKDGVYLYFKEL